MATFSIYLNQFRQNFLNLNLSPLWLSLLVVYPVLFMFQGLDFTDQGYWLTGYQRIFEDPASVSTMMPTWLSLVIGGLVDLTEFGVISFRIAFVLVVWATIWLTYRLLRACFNRKEILFPLFVTLVYITKWGVNWVSYNDLSALFFLAASLALWFGLQHKSSKWIVLSGFILGLGIYLRIPNVTGTALVAAILFAGWLYGWRIAFSLRFVIVFFLGITLGLLAGLLAMKLLGHLPYFLDSISVLRNQTAQPNYHHSSNMLLNLFIHDHIHALRYALLVIAVIIVVTWVRKQKCLNKLYENKFHLPAMRIGYIIIIIILAVYLEHELRYRWALPGFCYAVLMLGLVSESRRGSRSHALLYFIALILLVTVPLGSNNGIGNAIYGSWLALPLALLVLRRTSIYRSTIYTESGSQAEVKLLYQNKESEFLASKLKTKPWHLGWLPVAGVSKVIAGAILLFSGHLAYISTYRDSADRSALRYCLSAHELKGILTSKARSQVVGELLAELQGIIKPGDPLLAVTDIPMLNYLTHTRPSLSNPWTGLISQDQLASELLEIPKNGKALPVLVRTKGSVHNPEWPNVRIDPNYIGDGELLIRKFMVTYGYRKKWENQWFEIWNSNGRH